MTRPPDQTSRFAQPGHQAPRRAALLIASAIIGTTASPAAAAEPQASPAGIATVTVAKATSACFSDMVRVTGFIVPRKLALVNVESEGSKVTDVMVREGDIVTDNQELARLQPPAAPGSGATRPTTSLRAPAAGLVLQVRTAVGAPASPQSEPMFRIAIGNEIELDAEVPGLHMLKLNPGATVRISRDGEPDISGRVRLIAPEINRNTQLGNVRIALPTLPNLKVGMFARASIDARRSCGVAIPRTALDHQTVQVVNGNTIETRRIRSGLTSDTATEIIDGLKEGELVVADAGTSLHDGDEVRTIMADDDRTRTR
ncbi:MAG: efflux transporter periplasmic adaptor subunit [Tardiphaga sp.]|nr:efflux transporter periplasmic adaptor subunit [Tardiphaga sp.]